MKIILSNNGYKVTDMGIKVPAGRFIEAIKKEKPDALGMSGLLVQSAQGMLENIRLMQSENIEIPVLLGGAALTSAFVSNECQPIYNKPVIYCADAFEGLSAMDQIKEINVQKIKKKQGQKGRTGE
ncbi:MAG: cobalamin-dependent protein [bacterium]